LVFPHLIYKLSTYDKDKDKESIEGLIYVDYARNVDTRKSTYEYVFTILFQNAIC